MSIVTTHNADPVHAGGWTLIREAQRWHGVVPLGANGCGVVVWGRPAAVRAIGADGRERRLPVRDWTRLAQIALLGAGAGIAFWIGRRAAALHAQRSDEG